MEMEKELDKIRFYRKNILMRPKQADLLTLDDADEHKLASMNKLLLHMHQLTNELKSVGIPLQVATGEQHPRRENMFLLTDTEYVDWPEFLIEIRSNWLDLKYPMALHANFNFYMQVTQDGYASKPREVADWITVIIKHINIQPICLSSYREHVRVLQSVTSRKQSYFNDLQMEYATHVNFGPDGLSLRTVDFVKAIDDACVVMKKIIARKAFLLPVSKN
ncbi:TPA: hypothetical protein DIC62_03425 [Candidatus Nomurabacteria bacterium]|nr:hypothetical protein [Candidatus Nomurabacteria bacterium]